MRSDRSAVTRERILDAAERLFAERGVHEVSNRAVAEAAGQGNTAVVGYHFGTKTDLVRAVVHRHAGRIESIRAAMLDDIETAGDARGGLRAWIEALVRPTAAHLAELGSPTWYARFGAQITTDPALREIMATEALASPALSRLVEGLHACLPDLPPDVRTERGDIARLLMVHQFAERERALADGTPTPRRSWDDAATGLVDALVAIWSAPPSAARAAVDPAAERSEGHPSAARAAINPAAERSEGHPSAARAAINPAAERSEGHPSAARAAVNPEPEETT